jgi:hypothetical protein
MYIDKENLNQCNVHILTFVKCTEILFKLYEDNVLWTWKHWCNVEYLYQWCNVSIVLNFLEF